MSNTKSIVKSTKSTPTSTPVTAPVVLNRTWTACVLAAGTSPKAPKSGTVFAATLAAIGSAGCTPMALQAAIDALGLKGTHTYAAMLTYAAKNWGYGFKCEGGLITRV